MKNSSNSEHRTARGRSDARRRLLSLAMIFVLGCFLLGRDHYNVFAAERKLRQIMSERNANAARRFRLPETPALVASFMNGGDQCAGATNVPVGAVNDTGNTTGADSTIINYSRPALPINYPGPDVFYRIVMPSSGTIGVSMSLSGSTLDGAVFLTNVCPAGTGNVIPAANALANSQDAIGPGAGPEFFAPVAVPAGTYYVAVDSYYGSGSASAGPYSITITSTLSTAAGASVGGRVLAPNGSGLGGVRLTATDSAGRIRYASTNSFGYYRFDDLPTGETYVFQASSKKYSFDNPTQVVSVQDNISDLDFRAVE